MKFAPLAVLAVSLGLAHAACADPTYYSDPALFADAAGPTAQFSFPSDGPKVSDLSSPQTYGSLTFSTPNQLIFYNDNDYVTGLAYISATNFGTTSPAVAINGIVLPSALALDDMTFMNVTLDGVTALGFTLGTYDGADTISIEINGQFDTSITSTDGVPSSVFFGVISPDPITSVAFGITSDEFDILNYQTPVPEPSTMALVGFGVVGAAMWFVRRRRSVA